MTNKEAYEKKLQARMDQWKAEIDRLKAQAAEAQADAQLAYNKQIEQLHSQQQEAQSKFDELRRSGDDAWQDLKGGVESAWDSLEQAVQTAASRFK